jgi:hypothetical protein
MKREEIRKGAVRKYDETGFKVGVIVQICEYQCAERKEKQETLLDKVIFVNVPHDMTACQSVSDILANALSKCSPTPAL